MESKFKKDFFILSFILTITAVMRVQAEKYMEIRLMYGMNSAEGAVFMYQEGRWWPICSQSWTLDEAKVACKQLGFPYPYADSDSLPDYIYINVSRGRNWLDGFRCGGHESQLKWCSFSGKGNCPSGIAAGVTCHTVSESSAFESTYLWPLAMVMFGCFTAFVCYKKVREQHRSGASQTTTTTLTSSLEQSHDIMPTTETCNQPYPASPVIHPSAAFNGGNLKNTTYVTLPPSQNLQGNLSMATTQEDFLMTAGVEGNLQTYPEWGVSAPPSVPPSAPPPAGLAPSPAYQMPDSSPQQGFPHYPSQDPQDPDVPPPPSYEEATRSD